ncbi:MAG: xanthine dehydrogenase family protein molybdopterin-binding subunit, partial [Acetobacteraceae bacterium]|nr:xanthine dehydrogenase family protein molybdopterin-binding subunit [Acetobacteraceae bacterium]
MSRLQSAMKIAARFMPDKPTDPLIGATRHIGKALSRVDGRQKVTGRARFAAEVPFDNLTYAALVYSRIARGRIAAIDTTEAARAPGVVLVMTHGNAPRMMAPPVFLSDADAVGGSSLPVMQDDRIHWNGQPVALV